MNSDHLDWFASASVPAGVQAEVYRQEKETRQISIAEGQPYLTSHSHAVDYCLRVLKDTRPALLTTTRLSLENWVPLLNKAIELSSGSSVDEHRQFHRSTGEINKIDSDSTIFSESNSQIVDELKHAEQLILKSDQRIKKVLRLQKTEVRQQKNIVNTEGLHVGSLSSLTGYSGEILVSEGTENEAGWDSVQSRFRSSISLAKFAEVLAHDAVQLLGAKPIPSGTYPVLFHPHVGTALLSLLEQSLSAEAVFFGKSFLKGFLGKVAMSPLVSIVDDPTLPHGVATDSVDDEGTPHKIHRVVEKGQLNSYLYDIRSAARDRTSSTGHGLKSGLSSHPTPQATNLYVEAGSQTCESIMSQVGSFFLVRDVMGLHMADPISGEFSLGASGSWYEKGQFRHAVRGVTMAGTVRQIFNDIQAVANEIHWKGSMGCPYFMVPSLTIAGA